MATFWLIEKLDSPGEYYPGMYEGVFVRDPNRALQFMTEAACMSYIEGRSIKSPKMKAFFEKENVRATEHEFE